LERGHLRDLLRDTEFESTDFKLIILEGWIKFEDIW
jgi:hypothetical protein